MSPAQPSFVPSLAGAGTGPVGLGTGMRQRLEVLLRLTHQQGCQISQEDKDNQKLTQIQAPGAFAFHHHCFFPSCWMLCLSFPIQQGNSFQRAPWCWEATRTPRGLRAGGAVLLVLAPR